MSVVELLVEASNEKHDEPSLRVRMNDQIVSLLNQVSRSPNLTARLSRLLENPAQLKWLDAEDVVDAIGGVIDADDERLQTELLALTVTVARLGSVLMAMRLGRKAIEEMRDQTAGDSHIPH